MLAIRLQSLQANLHSHRRWLSAFIHQTSSFSSASHGQPAPPCRPSLHKYEHHSTYPHTAKIFPLGSQVREAHDIGGRARSPKKTPASQSTASRVNPIIADLRRAVNDNNLKHVMENYEALNEQDKQSLDRRDIRLIAQCVQYNVRKEKQAAANQSRMSEARDMVEFAELLARDTKNGKLVAISKAYVHLLGVFKETGSRDQGVRFWHWLREQDDTYVTAACYGAAIELLAVDGQPLPELEELYQEALGRFPGNFASYHLSPNAILPDRDQPFTIGGIPISLLQGILTARLLNGDTRNAYLALDTAVRLHPDQVPQRLFILFLDERPLEEAYAVFALACRSGNDLVGGYYKSMLAALRRNATFDSPAQHAIIVRAMLSATHLFIGSGGAVASNSVNELVIATSQFLRVKGVRALPAEDRNQLVEAVMEVIQGIFDVFARYGAKPTIPAFNSIITNLGGFGSSSQTVGVALKDADALGLGPTDVTWRSILAAAGMLRDKSLVERTWGHIRDSRIEAGENPLASDFHILVKPAHLSGAVEYAKEELDKFRHVIDEDDLEPLLMRLDDPAEGEEHLGADTELVDMPNMLAEIEKLKADVEVMQRHTEGSPRVQDFAEQILPMTLQPLTSSLGLPESQMRKIYDEFSLNPAARTPHDALSDPPETSTIPQPGPALNTKSKTNIPFGQLRFENWKLINSLLELSKRNDETYSRRVDEAIDAGSKPPRRTSWLVHNGQGLVSWGLSSVERDRSSSEGGKEEVSEEEFQRVRREILRLRGKKI